MGLLEHEFKRCTPIYFTRRLEGMRSVQEQKFRNEWERTRWQTAILLQPYSKRQINPRSLITFDWEKKDVLTIFEAVDKYKSIFEKLTP